MRKEYLAILAALVVGGLAALTLAGTRSSGKRHICDCEITGKRCQCGITCQCEHYEYMP